MAQMEAKRPGDYMCGLANWHPRWLQRYATTKTFMAVYGLLGTIQATSYMYFVVTLTTIEKRFKIPSQTTGIILSGNEISQIMLSLILSYVGGQRNRPRWIAWGIVFCGLSCYILALPHFIYGAGEDALQLTEEHVSETLAALDNSTDISFLLGNATLKHNQQLCDAAQSSEECDALLSIVPLVLIFLSQFVLGIGNTLYYSLGQTYLDDNTKKTNTPLMLALAMSLRMIGPVFGFLLGYISLNMFIDPTATPLIDNKDPRWLGAWWFGWTILGTLMVLFSGLIGLFPKQLPKKAPPPSLLSRRNTHTPHALRHEELQEEARGEGLPLGSAFSSSTALDVIPPATQELPKLKDFPKALMRLLRNKLLIFNIISAVFYILGAAGYMTFLTKYMEVQFHKSAQSATIVVGPVSIIGMVVGLIGSGLVISKKKPAPSKVLMWNVIVGFIYIIGQINYMFLYCGTDSGSMLVDGKLNVTAACNADCRCDGVPYSPVCHAPTGITYFSPCHAGCHAWSADDKIYSNCTCLAADVFTSTSSASSASSDGSAWWHSTESSAAAAQRSFSEPEIAVANMLPKFLGTAATRASTAADIPSTTDAATPSTTTTTTIQTTTAAETTTTAASTTEAATTTTPTTTTPITTTPTTTTIQTTAETTTTTTTSTTTTTTSTTTPSTTTTSTTAAPSTTTTTTTTAAASETSAQKEEAEEKLASSFPAWSTADDVAELLERRRRNADGDASDDASYILSDMLKPGVCLEGCQAAFLTFSIASMVINWFGSSGRIGNILVNYRSVSAQDKSFAQGLSLMLISLLALIPGPIVFGRIIDSTCLVWTKTCSGSAGNCQLYDQATFRYMVNITAICLTIFGVFFDILVWYYGRHLDLYGDAETLRLEQARRRNQPLTPLLAKK